MFSCLNPHKGNPDVKSRSRFCERSLSPFSLKLARSLSMPFPPRLCSCGQIVPADQPCACQVVAMRARKKRHDQTRPSSSARGYTGEWRKLRAKFLREHPFCAYCGVPAEHVDHKVRHQGETALLLLWSNLQSLCAHCHNSIKQRYEISIKD